MARKVIGLARNATGRKGSWRRRWVIASSIAVAASTGWLFLTTVQAVHDIGLFELDRNALDSTTTTGEDWETIYKAIKGIGGVTSTASAKSFTHDEAGQTIFIGGGSKDDLDTTSWRHTTGSVPDKDELEDAYAARYGDILYFGADRKASNGDAQMGFWFFQKNVQPQGNGTFGPDKHTNGDILVLSDFTKGGGLPTVRVFQWHSPGGAIDGTLDLLAGTTAAPQDCVGDATHPPVPSGDAFCGTVNGGDTPSPWPFVPKSGAVNVFHSGQFYEGGIDLGFLNLGGECFASFLAETRSSQSVDAVLKDFVGGSFESCNSEVKTTPTTDTTNHTKVTEISLGQSIYDYAVITGTGSNAAPTGTMTFSICAPDQLTNGACESGGTVVGGAVTVTPIAASNPPMSDAISGVYTPNAVGTWCWRGVYSGDSQYPTASDASAGECFNVVQLQPELTTAQTWTVQDAATVTVGAGAGNLNGKVTFKLYVNDPTCNTTNPVINMEKAITGSLSDTVNSDTLTITVPPGGTYSWKVDYISSNQGHKNVVGTCHNENGTLSFTNGVKEPQ